MNPKIIAAFAFLAIASQVDGACLCNMPSGRDMCHTSSSSGCAPIVIRPASLPKLDFEELSKPRVVCKQVGGLQGLKPVGDLCSCKQSIVLPALVPRPKCPCKTCDGTGSGSSSLTSSVDIFGTSTSGSSTSGSTIEYIPVGSGSVSYPESDSVYTAAADPVSLSLAYKLSNQGCASNEGKLSFGFRKLPVDGSKAQEQKDAIPEEKLFVHNGKVVELKPVACSSVVDVDEEALEELVATEFSDTDSAGEGGVIKKISYGELGFGPASVHNPTFVAITGSQAANPTPADSPAPTCNDGFVPGNVVIKNTPVKEIYVSSSKVPVDRCDDVLPVRYVSSYSSTSYNDDKHYSCGC